MPILKIGRHKLTVPDAPQRRSRGKPTREPRFSKAPWWGFSGHDQPRAEPLPACPSARCRRANKCCAAIDGLYCLRTHHDRFEQQWLKRHHPLARKFAEVPKVKDKRDFKAIAARAEKLMQLHREFDEAMTERWKAGSLDHLYGKWTPKGALLQPPAKGFVE